MTGNLRIPKIRALSFRVADVKHAPGIPLHMNWIMRGTFQEVRTWVRSSVIQLRDPLHVIPGLGKVRYPSAARHRSRARVVGGQGKLHGASVLLHERL